MGVQAWAAEKAKKAAAAAMAPEKPPLGYNKHELMAIGCCNCSSERRDAAFVAYLQKDLASSYYWSGSWCMDFVFFICNWHPLIGMFLCHPAHPWSKMERLGTFIFSLGLSFFPAALLAISAKDDTLNSIMFVSTLLFVTLPVMIWEISLYWVAIADIYCKGKGNCIAASCVGCVTIFKSGCMCVSVGFGVVFAGFSFMLVAVTDSPIEKMVASVFMGRVQSWILWFPIWTFLPYLGFVHYWCIERHEAQKSLKSVAPES